MCSRRNRDRLNERMCRVLQESHGIDAAEKGHAGLILEYILLSVDALCRHEAR